MGLGQERPVHWVQYRLSPGVYTFVAGVICVVVLWKGDKSEHVCYAKVAK